MLRDKKGPKEEMIRDFGHTRGDTYGVGKRQPVGKEGNAKGSNVVPSGCKITPVPNP